MNEKARGSTVDLRHSLINNLTLEDMVISENIANYTGSGFLGIDTLYDVASVNIEIKNCQALNNKGQVGFLDFRVAKPGMASLEFSEILALVTTNVHGRVQTAIISISATSYNFYEKDMYILLVIEGSNITGNNLNEYGAVYISVGEVSAIIKIINSKFISNIAENSGGGIRLLASSWSLDHRSYLKVHLEKVDFFHNTLKNDKDITANGWRPVCQCAKERSNNRYY